MVVLMTAIAGRAETWTPVGQVKWTEGALTGLRSDYNKTWNVAAERSDSRPDVYRLQPYASNPLKNINSYYRGDNVYIYLHVEDPNAVYIEYYVYYYFYDSSYYPYYFHVCQRCPENGVDSKYYGKFTGETIIEFPIGAFAVDEMTIFKPTTPSYLERYSTCIHKIEFPEGVLDYTPVEETWVNIGQGHWEDPIGINAYNEPDSKNISIEKSVLNPNKYRTKVFGDKYVTINAEDASKVYISAYSIKDGQGNVYDVTQNCKENGLSGSKYGTQTNGKITIPGDCFVYSTQSGEYTGRSDRKCEITLPDGFDNPIEEENGVFMGIIGFNEEVFNKPISLLNETTKNDFIGFVDDLKMGNATLLYYSVDRAINSLSAQSYPDNLSNAVLITFTDGLDEGSLAMKPEHRTSRTYASYLADRISKTEIQGCPLEAYAIGLKSDDVYDDELFTYNLESLASDEKHITTVNNIEEMQEKLSELFENLERQSSQRIVSIKVPMMSHGDKYRFTLDNCENDAKESKVYFEGVFNIDNNSLDDVEYHGFTSTSGTSIAATQDGIKLLFTLNDCRDENGNILEVDQDGIDQYRYISSRDIWNHNKENAKAGDIDIQNIKSSVAIMFALDCSNSLGDLFPLVKSTANSFISRLAGEGKESGIKEIMSDTHEQLDINDPEVEIYNLHGVRVNHPTTGLCICRKGNTVQKVIVR